MTTCIRLLGPADAALVCDFSPDVFDGPPVPALTAAFLSDPRHHLVAAINGGQIVGFVSAVHYGHPDKPDELWINEVGVATTHQRRGLGRQLMQAMLDHGRSLGCRNAWVLTEQSNTPARRLYAETGGVEAPVPIVLFEFPLADPPPIQPCHPEGAPGD